jgi:folate-binding protein YgfZ
MPVTLAASDVAPFAALRSGAVFIRRAELRHLAFTGSRAADVITGLVTNHVLALEPGHGQFAAALTAKGKIVADLRILRTGTESFLTTTGAPSWAGWRDLVRKYVNPRLARYTEESFETVSVFGPDAPAAITRALAAIGLALGDGDRQPRDASVPYRVTHYAAAHAGGTGSPAPDDGMVLRVASPELLEVIGEDVLLPAPLSDRFVSALEADPGVLAGSEAVVEVARIEVGRPRWGQDMDDTTIPQEANLGALGALSFEKGCYTGQETVARIHFRGHVNRHLRCVRSTQPLPEGADVRTAEGKSVGTVRSSAISPLAGPVAIAMIRREVSPGSAVQVVAGEAAPLDATILR